MIEGKKIDGIYYIAKFLLATVALRFETKIMKRRYTKFFKKVEMMNDNTNQKRSQNVVQENPLYLVSESKLIFRNNYTIINLSQISDIRLIKHRSFRLNITILALFYVLYIIVSPYLNFDRILLDITIGLIPLSVSFTIKRYSCKLLINVNNCNYNEIVVRKTNLSFAKILVDSFSPVISLPNDFSQHSETTFLKAL